MPEYMSEPGAMVRAPNFDYSKLGDRMGKSWVAQEVIRAMIQTFMKSGYKIEPKFVKKCRKCGDEFSYDIDTCPTCGSKKLDAPDREQAKKLRLWLNTPNSQRRTFRDVLYSINYYDLVYDVWYIAIENSKINLDGEEMLAPKEMRVLDSQYIRPVVDEANRFNSNEWYCPNCWDYRDDKHYAKPGVCPKCGYELKRTAYVQVSNSTITGRWYKEQISTGSSYSFMPNIFGEPRGKSLWNILLCMENMDQWFLDTFNEGRLQKIVNFPKYDQAKLTELMKTITAETQKLQVYDSRTQSYRTKKSLRVAMLTSEEPIGVYDVGINPDDIKLLDYYAMCINAVCGVYGVQPVYIGNTEKGKTGTTPAMQIDVQNGVIEDMQFDKANSLNNQLLPTIGITDWIISFVPPEKKDLKREADIKLTTSQIVANLQAAGFDVWFDEFDELKWSKKPIREPVIYSQKQDTTAKPKHEGKKNEKLSEATNQYINPTSTERYPNGPRPSTPQDEEREKQ